MPISQAEKIKLLELELDLADSEVTGTSGEARSSAFIKQAYEGVSGLPKLLFGQAPAAVAAGAQGLGGLVTGGDFDFKRRYEENLQNAPFPVSAALNIPRDVDQLAAGVTGAKALFPGGQSPGEAYREDLAGLQADRAQLEEQFPISTQVGEVGGDVATLLTARAPLSKPIRSIEELLKASKKPASEMFPSLFSKTAKKVLGPEVRGFLADVAASPKVKALARGAGRSMETGTEAAILSILHDEDPMEMAGLAAGGQIAGSMLMTGSKGLVSGGLQAAGIKIGSAAVAVASIWQILQDITPGGRDALLESLSVGYEKVTLGLVLGAAAGVSGAGRMRGDSSFSKRFQKIADGIATAPRAATLSIVEDLVRATDETQQDVQVVLNQLTQDPEYFGKYSSQIQAGLNNGKLVSIIEELKATEQAFSQELFKAQPRLPAKKKDMFEGKLKAL